MAQAISKSAISVGKKTGAMALGGLVVMSGLVGGGSAASATPVTGAFAGVSTTEGSMEATLPPAVPEGEMLVTKVDGTTATTSEGATVSLEGAVAVTIDDMTAQHNPELLAEVDPSALLDINPEWVDENKPEIRTELTEAQAEALKGVGGGGNGAVASMSVRPAAEIIEVVGSLPEYFILSDGTIAFCAEPGVGNPSGTGATEYRTAFPGYYSAVGFDLVETGPIPMTVNETTPAEMKALALLMMTDADPMVKAVAIWNMRTGDAGFYQNMAALAARAPEINAAAGALIADVNARAANYFSSAAEAQAYVDAQSGTAPTDPTVVATNPNNVYLQTVTAFANADSYTDEIRITGGAFTGTAPAGVTYSADMRTATIAPRTTNVELPTELRPTKSAKKLYSRSLAATWKASASVNAEWIEPAVSSIFFGDGMQRTVYGPAGFGSVSAEPGGRFDLRDPLIVSTEFSPLLQSKVVTVKGKVGEPLTLDTLEFSTLDDIEWRRDYTSVNSGEYTFREIQVKANVYYHGKAQPVPSDAPYGETSRLVGTVAPITVAGPGPFTGEIPAPRDANGNVYIVDEAGFYVYQWIIDAADQNEDVREILPENYYFADQYGDPNETPIIPPVLGIDSILSDDEITLDEGYDENGVFQGFSVSDNIMLGSEDTGWLVVANQRIPIISDVNFYVYKGDKPELQDTVPADAKLVGTAQATITGPRTYVPTDEIEISMADFREYDGVTAVACVNAASQDPAYVDMVNDECHQYGVASETAKFVKPEVRTEAKQDGAVPGLIYDTAILEKSDLPVGSTIGATAYKTPTVGDYKYTTNWTPVLNEEGVPQRWTAEEIAAIPADELCTVQQIAQTERVDAREQGRYKLPDVRALSGGSINWVEDTLIPGGEDGVPIEWSRGMCGDVNEITEVEEPGVKTDTQFKDVYPGNENWDNLHVSGIAEGEDFGDWEFVASVEGFYTDTYEGEAVCKIDEDSNKIVDLDVEGPITENITYESERYTVKKEWLKGRIDHVETLQIRNKVTEEQWELVKGECGYSTESTVVPDPDVTTKVQNETVLPGDTNWDNIIVKDLPEIKEETGGKSQYTYEATVEIFVADSHDAKAVCNDPALTLDPVEVKGNGVTESAHYTVREEWAGKRLDHVETLWAVDAEGKRIEVKKGECGAANESSFVKTPPPVNTGTDSATWIALGAGGVILLAGAAVTAYALNRKKLVK